MSCSSAYMTYKLLYSSLFSVSPVGSGSGGHSRTVLDSPSSVRSEGNRCKFCQKYYSSSWHRKRHELIHTGQKPFVCKFCHSAFNQRNHLSIHERKHTGYKPYACQFCNVHFARQPSRKAHENKCPFRNQIPEDLTA